MITWYLHRTLAVEIRAADNTHPRSGKHTCEADRTPALAVFDVSFYLSIRYES
ncbi:MAG: hypothetical protein Q8S04_06030 [Bacteroidales bacterium]|nr:hypothetical protein [Bacteroidales bacterium]